MGAPVIISFRTSFLDGIASPQLFKSLSGVKSRNEMARSPETANFYNSMEVRKEFIIDHYDLIPAGSF